MIGIFFSPKAILLFIFTIRFFEVDNGNLLSISSVVISTDFFNSLV